jgi:hypothetical protein
MLRSLALSATCAAISTTAQALELTLVCQGQTQAQVAHGSFATACGDNKCVNANGFTTRTRETADVLTVELHDSGGRIQVPRAMLPPIHGPGKNGWWDLDELQVNDREITGRYSVNVLNVPRVRIDRQTGTITIDGHSENYRGSCEVADPAARKF